MKRILWTLLVCLLLCGCGGGEPAQTEAEWTDATVAATEATITATEPSGYYLQNSEMETATGGAVRSYELDMTNIRGIATAGEDLLVFSGLGSTTITRLTGNNLYQKAQLNLDTDIPWQSVDVRGSWVIYYDRQAGALIYLDEYLTEVRRVNLEADLQGYPALSDDGKRVYYCTTSGVRCLDLDSGISRLIKEITFPIQTVSDVMLDDQMLTVAVSDGIDHSELLYLDAQTGSYLASLPEEITMTAGSSHYYAIDPEGLVRQMIFGTREDAWMLTPANYLDSGIFLPEVHGALVQTRGNTLEYYDLTSGKRTAAIAVDLFDSEAVAASQLGYLYFLQEDTLYRWDLAATPLDDETVYTGPWYSLAAPDTAGLEACRQYAEQLSEKHGLNIQIYDDAVNVLPFDYNLIAEYQVPVIRNGLAQLEQIISHFPDGVFETAVEGLEDGRLTVCLVRDLVGGLASGIQNRPESVQFWDGNHAYVALALGENLEQNFYHDMFHVLETRVLSESIAYYRWDELNPKKFEYDYDYVTYLDRDSSPWLEGDNRAFIDAYSMTFPKEDRARIMEYACMAGNESYFMSNTMQKKLHTICTGIREAYGLQEYPAAMLWEQYLEEPIHP